MRNRRIDSPGFYIAQLTRLHRKSLAAEVEELGINYGQISLVMQALSCPGKSQDEISNTLGIDKAATARRLAALERSGFIVRRENIENRRQKLVYPTDKAWNIEERLRTVLEESKERSFRGFTPQEREQAIDMLIRMVDAYRESLGQPPFEEKDNA